MSTAVFKHVRLSMLNDVVLVEIMSTDVQGPARAQEFSAELTSVAGQEGARPLLVDFRRSRLFSSMAFAALFRLVKEAKARLRPIKFCNMHPDVRVGAEAVGLKLVVEIHDSEKSALEALAQVRGAADQAHPAPDPTSSGDSG